MASKSKSKEITEEMVTSVKNLIGTKDEVNLEWLLTVTQLPITTLSKIIIQKIGMVILEKTIYSKAKAEKRLKQIQEEAQQEVDRETFRKSSIKIDMMLLREKLWTVYLRERLFGQQRHQFCPIWIFIEENTSSTIALRHDWIARLEIAIKKNAFNELKIINAINILNELGEEYKGKAKAIFARTFPQDSIFGTNKAIWLIFLVYVNKDVIQIAGLNMINILTLSTKFKSREKTYEAFNKYLELINLLVIDQNIFDEVIIVQ